MIWSSSRREAWTFICGDRTYHGKTSRESLYRHLGLGRARRAIVETQQPRTQSLSSLQAVETTPMSKPQTPGVFEPRPSLVCSGQRRTGTYTPNYERRRDSRASWLCPPTPEHVTKLTKVQLTRVQNARDVATLHAPLALDLLPTGFTSGVRQIYRKQYPDKAQGNKAAIPPPFPLYSDITYSQKKVLPVRHPRMGTAPGWAGKRKHAFTRVAIRHL